MTLSDLRKSDHGVYECVVSNEVATIVARTALLIERTTPHAPTNVTVTSSETFAVTISWHPGFSGCSSCQQTYKIRFVIWHENRNHATSFKRWRLERFHCVVPYFIQSLIQDRNIQTTKLQLLLFLGHQLYKVCNDSLNFQAHSQAYFSLKSTSYL